MEFEDQLLNKKTLLLINQTRIKNTNTIPGKGYNESLEWANHFKKVFFLCFSDTGKMLFKRIKENYFLIAYPFDLSDSIVKTIKDLARNYIGLINLCLNLIKKEHIDLIRSENLIIAGIPIFFISKITRLPNIIWLGGFERIALDIKYKNKSLVSILKKAIIILEYILLNSSRFVITVSDELLELCNQRKVKNKWLSPNFVNFSIFKEKKFQNKNWNKEKIKLLYAGRLEQEKGIMILMDALKLIHDSNLDFDFRIVGDGSLRIKIEDFITNNHLQKQIKLLGKVDFSKMPEIYHDADIFVLPSYTEGMSASLSEAMASSCACICTKVGMNEKIIENGINGIIINPGDSTALTENIIKLIKEPEKIVQFGQNARKTIYEYSKNYLIKHSKLYKMVLESIKKIRK